MGYGKKSNSTIRIDNKDIQDKISEHTTQLAGIATNQGVSVEDFKFQIPDVDDTARINRSIQYAKDNGINRVVFASKIYDVHAGTITIDEEVELIGFYGTQATNTNDKGATVLLAYNSTTTQPVINASVPDGSYITGLKITNIIILGSTGWADNNQANWADRESIHLENVAREFQFQNVYISGFKRHALYGKNLWDGTFLGAMSVINCGTEVTYPAVYFTGGTDNTNAVHVFGLHLEHCPFMLKLDKGARNNQFVGCKFEVGMTVTNIPILIESDAQENTFQSCHFTNLEGNPYLIKINNMHTVISGGCTFTSPLTNGAKWIDSSASYGAIIMGNIFRHLDGSVYSIALGSNSSFKDNVLWVNTKSGVKNGMSFVSENIIQDNFVKSDYETIDPTSGNLFYSTGANNSLKNKIFSRYFTRYNMPSANTVFPIAKTDKQVELNSATPKLDTNTDVYNVNNTVTTAITDFLGVKYLGKEITLFSKEATNVTTINNNTYIQTISSANITMTRYKTAKFIYADAGQGAKWIEV